MCTFHGLAECLGWCVPQIEWSLTKAMLNTQYLQDLLAVHLVAQNYLGWTISEHTWFHLPLLDSSDAAGWGTLPIFLYVCKKKYCVYLAEGYVGAISILLKKLRKYKVAGKMHEKYLLSVKHAISWSDKI